MSSLTGHSQITAEAIKKLAREFPHSPLLSNFNAANLPGSVVQRDIMDVLSGGHWADFGQKHHFMRKFDSQSPYQAYLDAVEWIRSNALDAAQMLAKRVARYFPKGIGSLSGTDSQGRAAIGGMTVQTPRGPMIADVPSWQTLGNAVHALQDSFAAGHTVRGTPMGPEAPGAIEHVKRYSGAEKVGHKEGDDAWTTGSASKNLSLNGELAVNATTHLLLVVVGTALSERGESPPALIGWEKFKDQWLRASPKLSRQADLVFELIDRFYSGVRIGAHNVKTMSMDENGLASALVKEVGTNTRLARQVFERLDDQYNSDADDVAEIYVNQVRKQGGGLLTAVRADRELIARLIKVMDEGWTSSGESECIKFLRGLQKV